MNSLPMMETVGHANMEGVEGSKNLGPPACCGKIKKYAPFVMCSKCVIPIKVGKDYFKLEVVEEASFNSETFVYILCRFCIKVAEEEAKKNPEKKFTVREEKLIPIGEGKSTKIPELKATLADFRKQILEETDLEPTTPCGKCRKEYHNICSGYIPVSLAPEHFQKEFICESCPRENPLIKCPMDDILKHSMLEITPLSEYMEIITNLILVEKLETLQKMSYYKPVHVRVVSSAPKTFNLPPVLADFIKKYDIGSRFNYRNRMILCFQEVETPDKNDGKVVAFFAIYTQEYGADAPLPNRNSVYLSIIDSVKFFEPFEVRRYAYFPILSSYIIYSTTWGAEKMFLWACPPLNDTEYVFYRRPANQKNLSGVKLTQWYKDFMSQCKTLRIINDWQELKHWVQKSSPQEFFQNFPLFHEDFWPGQITQIIEAVDKGEIKDDTDTKRNSAHKKKPRLALPAKDPKDRETLIFERVVALLKQQNNFFCMTINQDFNLTRMANVKLEPDPQIENYLGSSRDVLVKFLQSGNLRFGCINEAVYSTRRILVKITGEQPRFCEICLEKIIKGKLQKGGDLLLCCECWKNFEGSGYTFVDYLSHTWNSSSKSPMKYPGWDDMAAEWCQRNKNVVDAIAKSWEDVTRGTSSVDDMLKDLNFLSRMKGLAVWKHVTGENSAYFDNPTCPLCSQMHNSQPQLLSASGEIK